MNIQVDKVNKFIELNLKKDFSLTDVANYVNYSSYHLAREYKKLTGYSIMDYARERKIFTAAQEIASGELIIETALSYGFDTHSGFTRAFLEIIGCSPQEYHQHHIKLKSQGEIIMDKAKLKIRLVCKDDVNSLWENVYSAMTPRQILEEKIEPQTEAYKNGTGFLAVAELDGQVVMPMWVSSIYGSPGFIYDTIYKWQNNENDRIFTELLEGAKNFAKQLHMDALCLMGDPEEDSPYMEGYIRSGFKKVFSANDRHYYKIKMGTVLVYGVREH